VKELENHMRKRCIWRPRAQKDPAQPEMPFLAGFFTTALVCPGIMSRRLDYLPWLLKQAITAEGLGADSAFCAETGWMPTQSRLLPCSGLALSAGHVWLSTGWGVRSTSDWRERETSLQRRIGLACPPFKGNHGRRICLHAVTFLGEVLWKIGSVQLRFGRRRRLMV
jgi:hypothetical protein